MTDNRTLEVLYHGNTVGTLAEMPDRRIAFQYSEEWIRNGFSISPLSLPLNRNVFVPHERTRDRFEGLFGVFADCLPDAWGRLLLDRYLESIGIKRENIKTLDRLAYIGSSGMGALEYHPCKKADFDIADAEMDIDTIAMECEKLLSAGDSDAFDLIYKIGASSGGTRPKILISEAGKEWIIKFPSKNDPAESGKMEYDYYTCAKKAGIKMSDSQLIKSSICDGYFKTKRFDRIKSGKLFTITMAALLEADFRAPSCNYESLFKLVRLLTKDNREDKEQLFRTMCFNVLAHNKDDHAKNFSFTYSEEKGWRLAPAYDLTYSDTYWGEQTTSVNGKGTGISKDDIITVGTGAGLSKNICEKCYEEVSSAISPLKKYTSKSGTAKGRHISFSERIAELAKE
ncbi:MAG: type II toxin-antitoxin system HipA family toxin [Lachnospiraceae bacterium]|nr:type II toxin-antitoxin system HipA family toxin [Lachnospiraceae bacterium]